MTKVCNFDFTINYNILIRSTAAFVIVMICCSFSMYSQSKNNYKKEIESYREHYKMDFLKANNSPLTKKDLKYLRFYEPDERFKVVAIFKPSTDTARFEMPTYSGKTKTFVRYGTLNFKLDSAIYTLTIYRNLKLASQAEYKDYLFLPFKDKTSGFETYGGGRYVDLREGEIGSNNKYILDFNKCYNPYCAYSDGYNCPIPPLENHLNISLTAGEKMFAKAH